MYISPHTLRFYDNEGLFPCIERNAVAAKRAYDAAKYAMLTDGYHTITLDQVMQTMKETGHDLMAKYRISGVPIT